MLLPVTTSSLHNIQHSLQSQLQHSTHCSFSRISCQQKNHSSQSRFAWFLENRAKAESENYSQSREIRKKSGGFVVLSIIQVSNSKRIFLHKSKLIMTYYLNIFCQKVIFLSAQISKNQAFYSEESLRDENTYAFFLIGHGIQRDVFSATTSNGLRPITAAGKNFIKEIKKVYRRFPSHLYRRRLGLSPSVEPADDGVGLVHLP